MLEGGQGIWKKDLIVSTFLEEVAEKILCIPLAEEPHDDFWAWSGEASSEYIVCSAYKLLQSIEGDPTAYVLQADYKEFYKKTMAIWGDRNARVHKKASKSGKEIVSFVNSYILELDESDKRNPKNSFVTSKWRRPPDQVVKINFDAAYDARTCQSTVGVVARNSEGGVLLSCSAIHQRVASAFAAEALACRTRPRSRSKRNGIGRENQIENERKKVKEGSLKQDTHGFDGKMLPLGIWKSLDEEMSDEGTRRQSFNSDWVRKRRN
ncbi:hypothetical protein PVK06_047845 [Gossypium arboreum]|uniref:Uncharacterized protein n=1 Tax=Gossypium arboreum TaxID=29729 RepID=A0ABR0MGZ4_GOSAR|nr:hypothetical protein PVK06_047845 [Gossypium arboreum]